MKSMHIVIATIDKGREISANRVYIGPIIGASSTT